jgi:ribosomal protein S18 acetylase RimI-like enzyme
MRAAERFAREDGAYGLQLETAHTNARAQALYESDGYARDAVFRVYVKEL